MDSFLKEVVSEVQKKDHNVSELIFILPSKRAGLFLKKELLEKYAGQTFFAPIILSIEEFITQLSGLRQIDGTQTLFEFYETYLTTHTHLEKENLETFSSWAQTLVYDFNEIDRYCIDNESFFSYLSGIQDLNHWYLQKEKTELIQKYISFWNNLSDYYINFKTKLLEKKIGYQGLLYRKASENIEDYIKKNDQKHILVGFNALNNAEQVIFQSLLEANTAEVYWDVDTFFLENKYHEASLFLRDYKTQWNYYQEKPFKWIRDNFSSSKDIKLIGVPKNVGQAKLAGQILRSIPSASIEKTALVLADESLLLPVLNSLPETISSLNITMGLPLKDVPVASFFELLFKLHKATHSKGLYHKSVLEILNSQPSYWLLGSLTNQLITKISRENLIFISLEKLQNEASDAKSEVLDILFSPWNKASKAIEQCRKIVQLLKESLDKEKDSLELEYVYHFHLVFNKLLGLSTNYQYIKTISSLYHLYKDIINSETLDFRGEPFSGLQLMGMLESRCLDFETVIITSVNEGVLPAGKSMNSFIPYDLKRAYNLPTYKEKDAIYTYHFYRLIQRAKNVYLIYNTEDEGVGGGEKSRFLHQLEIDKIPSHQLSKYIASSEVPKLKNTPLVVEKNDAIIQKIKELALNGLSPSALTSYIRNPIDFYYKYVLGISESDQVEETIAANTLGTVIHNTLENLYKPLEDKFVSVEDITNMIALIDTEIKYHFRKEYSKLDITQGKNLLIFEVAKRYIYNFLKREEKMLKSGSQLKIIAIESNLKTELRIPELDFPVFIKGKVDRIDELDGQLRIIDYKTGKVIKSDVVLMDWDVITEDYKYSKAIQVLAYAYMQYNQQSLSEPFQAGIISFKNLKEGFLKFGTKTSVRGKVDYEITTEVFDEYLLQLKKLITEISTLEIPFTEKEV
ncbi:PD-(D/E)XK nuclease family protein [Aquimarina sp. BL5]|uniref:PD-(D/E)XK nuclease family protein n=1 Tax=Aquimarina sp. BL5 TaxID=1714860 RepID=UPI000E4CDB21|nr:PD-(D/E)XK nuclease family protein [Aquimarina sp. BL5]AXT52075.1 PD-(D/E)XK nuclease family protein [Aquimarina sp. BL5]RKN11187.1 PD-(D/E)XK nuclease family protein [Aquimarina sp. BL5]